MIVVLALISGGLLGFVLERGGLCFHSTWRGLFTRPRQTNLVKSYGLYLVLAIPILQVLIAADVINPWVAPLVWQANLLGGLVFGAGMVIASTCVTGIFYKFGHGMLGAGFAAVGWVIGDILVYRGPLEQLRQDLTDSPLLRDGETATATNVVGWVGVVVVVAVVIATAVVLYQRRPTEDALTTKRDEPWTWVPLGLALVVVATLGWLLVTLDDGNYSFGTSGVPTRVWDRLRGMEATGESWWIPLALIATVPGAFIAAKMSSALWVRGETPSRYAQLAVGGLTMGIGAGIAGGCNLGHSLVGVPLLSLGSIASTLAMIGGVYVGANAIKLASR